jgi:hypothetical protein
MAERNIAKTTIRTKARAHMKRVGLLLEKDASSLLTLRSLIINENSLHCSEYDPFFTGKDPVFVVNQPFD